MIIRNFEYLLALAKERHFARAAAACGVSQPTLSGGIKQLEEDMDVLIVRRGRAFEGFTVEGERVLAWAQQMMNDCLRLKQELRTFRENGMQGAFRIGVLPATTPLGSTLSVPFAEQAPALDLSIRTASAPELLNLLRAGELDIALTYVDESASEGLATHLLYRERMFFFTAAQEPLAARISWEDVVTQPLCLLASSFPASLAEHLAQAPKVLYTDSPSVLAAHVRSGKWAAILPQSLAGALTPSPKLRAIPLRKSAATEANVGFVTTRLTPLPAPVHAFMELAHSPKVVSAIREMLDAHRPYLASVKRPIAR
ncbi:LysR family transcriptional regulator [Silvibacterium dinghuense]|uniref:LysR family transcriptional regulator n=1 Tax=Silvibacterium dinghuense TaxID=1560006 RepID=A0A4Q1SI50_9BACT|nr:LysR family transcriptional regulator [Silvibacterium dinghuense]RXS97043.1 LysR family transcriptional regulator [Silvibacterium dinghuense]GGG95703.1 LysR family transcriptional regulator [Silvibacterium dinghuense]